MRLSQKFVTIKRKDAKIFRKERKELNLKQFMFDSFAFSLRLCGEK
jgi:hypothetical protein